MNKSFDGVDFSKDEDDEEEEEEGVKSNEAYLIQRTGLRSPLTRSVSLLPTIPRQSQLKRIDLSSITFLRASLCFSSTRRRIDFFLSPQAPLDQILILICSASDKHLEHSSTTRPSTIDRHFTGDEDDDDDDDDDGHVRGQTKSSNGDDEHLERLPSSRGFTFPLLSNPARSLSLPPSLVVFAVTCWA